jgi:GT2 family glycosyltransferase
MTAFNNIEGNPPEQVPVVAVIIVNFNAGELLNICLHSIELQSLQPWKCLVIDNASNDFCVEELKHRFPSIEVIRLAANLGFAEAVNIGVSKVRDADWIALLNPDAFPDIEWLSKLVEATRKFPDYASFSSRQLWAENPSILDGAGDNYYLSGRVRRRGHGASASSSFLEYREVFSACAGAALYKSGLFREVGGFDKDFFCYLEDVDFGFRIRLQGYRCLYVPDAVVRHVGSALTGRHSDFSIYHGHRNLVWTYIKNMPGLLFWLYLPQHILLNLVSLIWFSLRKQGRVILRAKRDAIKGVPKMWRKRRVIQSNRVATVHQIWRLMDKRLIPTRRG